MILLPRGSWRPKTRLVILFIAFRRVLSSVKHLLNESEYEAVTHAVAKLQNQEGPELQAFLQQRFVFDV